MLKAVVFDLDGTVLDNEDVWEAAFQQVLGKKSSTWIHEPGLGLEKNWEMISGPERAVEYAQKTREAYKQLVGDGSDLQIRAGFEEVASKIKEMGLLTALATSSYWTVVEDILENLSMYLAFDVTTTGEEVARLKPDPEIYLLTAQKLGVDAEQCLVVEDAYAGVESAAQAGCLVAAIKSSYSQEKKLRDVGAKWVIGELTGIISIIEHA